MTTSANASSFTFFGNWPLPGGGIGNASSSAVKWILVRMCGSCCQRVGDSLTLAVSRAEMRATGSGNLSILVVPHHQGNASSKNSGKARTMNNLLLRGMLMASITCSVSGALPLTSPSLLCSIAAGGYGANGSVMLLQTQASTATLTRITLSTYHVYPSISAKPITIILRQSISHHPLQAQWPPRHPHSQPVSHSETIPTDTRRVEPLPHVP